jgi:hypothetical protein
MSSDGGKAPALAALQAAERRHGWFDVRLDGWSAWRVLRTPVYNIAAALPLSHARESRTSQFKRGLKSTARVLGCLLLGRRRDVLVKSFRSALRSRQGEHFRDVYFDGVLDRQPSHFKVEVVNTAAFDHQAAMALRPADVDAYAFTFWGVVLGRLFPRREIAGFCHDLAATLRSEVGVEVSSTFLMRRLSALHWESRLYALLLSRLHTRLVMVADTSEYALRHACTLRNIPFVEMQHGVFDEDHPDAVPDWVSGAPAELLLPDTLACYGPYWIERLASSRQYRLAQPIGNELVDRFRTQRANRPPAVEGTPTRLLFTSQGIDTERAIAWLDALLGTAPAGVRPALTIKLHPAYDHDLAPYASLVERHGVRLVAGAQEPNVWELLAESDLHLSISSACHFDAAALGVHSVVMPLQGHYLMEAAIDGRTISAAPTPEFVWTLSAVVDGSAASFMARYASPGFVDRIDALINRLRAAPGQAPSSSAGELQ